MQKREPLFLGHYYHIYNSGNNGQDVFLETENYYYFLRLYAKYIEPIAETYAWCLLKNHFHFLIRIKDESEINPNHLTYSTIEKPKIITPSKQFSHLFNAYTQAINKKHQRTGSLFEKNFERKLISTEAYFQQLIFYIHNNPVKHGFVDKMNLYPWSSFESVTSDKPTMIKRSEVLTIFGDKEGFLEYHSHQQNTNAINDFIIEN